jgi:hypothetical protein
MYKFGRLGSRQNAKAECLLIISNIQRYLHWFEKEIGGLTQRAACTRPPGDPGTEQPGQGAGRRFPWLGAGSGKAVLPRLAHQPPAGVLRDG